MSMYPNYYANQGQNQGQMYQQNFNPMMAAQQRLFQMEQQYPQFSQQNPFPMQQMIGLNGRFVDDFNTISANDVPMDGNGAVFIKKDGSEIQIRNWAANGTIQMTSYKPILEDISSDGINTHGESLNVLYDDVRALREEIAERFDRLERSISNPVSKATTSKAKKEADSE